MSQGDALRLGVCVAESPGYLSATRASLLGSLETFTWPWLLLIRDHLHAAGPSSCPLGSSRCTKLHQTAECKKAFPALQGGVGREGEHSPPAPSLFLRGLCFLSGFLEFSTCLMMCVLLRRFLSFFSPAPIRFWLQIPFYCASVCICSYNCIVST